MANIQGFLPSRSGLGYVNNWPDVPDIKIPTMFGDIGLGSAANGLCGGMAFAARDLFEARRTPPPGNQNPIPDSAAFKFLVNRLFDSFNLPGGVAQYYEWMALPRHDTLLMPGTSRRTITQSMPRLRALIDAGHPCPLGVIRVHSADPGLLGNNHQVLAWGYEEQGANTIVRVYDPNHPGRDDVAITFDHTHPSQETDFHYSGDREPIFGFFVVDYTPRDPSALFDDGHQGPRPPPRRHVPPGDA